MSDNSSKDEIRQEHSSDARKRSRGNVTMIVCTIVIVLAVVVCGIVICLKLTDRNDPSSTITETVSRNVVVTPDNVKEILEQTEAVNTTPGRYEVTMNTSWTFENGHSASSNAYVENSTSNTNAVYFDIVRSDTNETIYRSPILPVGSHLENIALDTELAAGNYSCVLTYFLVDDNYNPVSKLNINLDITVNH